jgi:hypothetical protein
MLLEPSGTYVCIYVPTIFRQIGLGKIQRLDLPTPEKDRMKRISKRGKADVFLPLILPLISPYLYPNKI